jgi:hypothetical protein
VSAGEWSGGGGGGGAIASYWEADNEGRGLETLSWGGEGGSHARPPTSNSTIGQTRKEKWTCEVMRCPPPTHKH